MSNLDRLFPIAEALPLLGIKPTKFFALVNEGKLEVRKIVRRTVIAESTIRDFQNSLPVRGGTAAQRAA